MKKWTRFRRVYLRPRKYIGRLPDVWYRNSRYVVAVWKEKAPGPRWHLSIRNVDRSARHDWRDFQRIKNELCGEEDEAIELYPSESRLVDLSNQFHLWVYPPNTIDFGFSTRAVSRQKPGGRARQRR